MGEHPRHDRQAEARDQTRRSPVTSPRRDRDQSDHGPKGQSRGQPTRNDVKANRVTTSSDNLLDRFTEGRGNSEQPAPERRVLGIIAEHPVDKRGSGREKRKPLAQEVVARYVRPGRTSSGSSVVIPGSSSVSKTARNARRPRPQAIRPEVHQGRASRLTPVAPLGVGSAILDPLRWTFDRPRSSDQVEL